MVGFEKEFLVIDSGSGGTCTVFVMTGAPQISACLVCVGGTDNGNADCI